MNKLLSVIFIVAIVSSCKKETAINSLNPLNPEIAFNNCSGNIIEPTDGIFKICYDSLVGDSRCPVNVNCIWQGAAIVKLSLHRGSSITPFTLATIQSPSMGLKNDTIINGIKIQLEDVLPYPQSRSSYNVAESKVKLKISF